MARWSRFRWRHWRRRGSGPRCLAESSSRCQCGVRRGNNYETSFGLRQNTNEVQCVPNIRVFTSPSAEGFELAFGLTHPGAEEVEFAQGRGTGLGITVGGIEPRTKRSICSETKVKIKSTACGAQRNLCRGEFNPMTEEYLLQTTLCFLAAAINSLWWDNSWVAGFVMRTCMPRSIA